MSQAGAGIARYKRDMKTTSAALLVALACGCSSGGESEAPNRTDAAVSAETAVDSAETDSWTPDAEPEVTEPDLPCTNIIDACHEADPGYGPIHDCHELGHTGTVEDCLKAEKDCLALCSDKADAATD